MNTNTLNKSMDTNTANALETAAKQPLLLASPADETIRARLGIALTEAPLTPDAWILTREEELAIRGGSRNGALLAKADRHAMLTTMIRAVTPAVSVLD